MNEQAALTANEQHTLKYEKVRHLLKIGRAVDFFIEGKKDKEETRREMEEEFDLLLLLLDKSETRQTHD
jgi:hypothetical protein